MYDTVFIDWDGTLSKSRFWQQWQNDTQYAALYQTITAELFSDNKDVSRSWMRGELSSEDICHQLASTSDVSNDVILGALRHSCESMIVADGALDKVEELRSLGVKVILATDNMDTFSRWTIPALSLGKKFDGILNSADMGFFKKEKDDTGGSLFFKDYLSTDGLCALIDDSPDNAVVEDFGIKWLAIGDRNIMDWLDYLISATGKAAH